MGRYLIIGFWSEEPGKGSSTYNMIASGISLSAKCKERVILMQGKKDYNRIEYAFTPYESSGILKEDYGYYNYGGVDSLINKVENGIINDSEFSKELVQIRKSNLYYLPSSRSENEDNFRKRFMDNYDKLSTFLAKTKDIVMLELNSGLEYLTDNVINQLDLLVINIPQNTKAIKMVNSNNKIMDKAVFIIGCYDMDSEYSINNIRRMYGIDEKRIYAVPYNVRFKDAICGGRSLEFYERHSTRERNDSEFEFMKNLDMLSEMIMKRCKVG